jgi:hypothetical protein
MYNLRKLFLLDPSVTFLTQALLVQHQSLSLIACNILHETSMTEFIYPELTRH